MTTIESVRGDHLDELIAAHYGAGSMSAALDAVLAANLGLAAAGDPLPEGTRIALPDLSATPRGVELWS